MYCCFLLASFVERVVFMCSHQVTVGPEGDGGWDVCIDKNFDISSPCLVYSFGYETASKVCLIHPIR